MRIVFMGTPEFAVPSLKALIREGYEIAGVFTQPDRPKGRGKKPAPGPVKIAAEEAGIPVFQPERIRKTGAEPTFHLLCQYSARLPPAWTPVPVLQMQAAPKAASAA